MYVPVPLFATLTLSNMDTDQLRAFVDLQLTGPEMLIDGYDQYNQQESEVVNISPDDHSEDATENVLRADSCESSLRLRNIEMLMPGQMKR